MSSNQICKKFGWPLLSFKTADILYEVALESPILPLHSPPAFFAPLVVCQALYHKLVSSRGGPYIPISRPEFRDRHVSSYERFRSVMTDITLYTTSKHDIQKKIFPWSSLSVWECLGEVMKASRSLSSSPSLLCYNERRLLQHSTTHINKSLKGTRVQMVYTGPISDWMPHYISDML